MDESNPKQDSDAARLRWWGLGLALALVALQVILDVIA